MSLNSIFSIVGLFAIVSITELIKKIDKKKLLKRVYVLLPIPLSTLVAFLMTQPFGWKFFAINILVYTSISAYAYDLIKKTLDSFLAKTFPKE